MPTVVKTDISQQIKLRRTILRNYKEYSYIVYIQSALETFMSKKKYKKLIVGSFVFSRQEVAKTILRILSSIESINKFVTELYNKDIVVMGDNESKTLIMDNLKEIRPKIFSIFNYGREIDAE